MDANNSNDINTDGNLLGQVNVVANSAVVIMDNNDMNVYSGAGFYAKIDENAAVTLTSEEKNDSGLVESTLPYEKRVAEHAYYMDNSMESVIVPDGIEALGEFCFARSALKNAFLPDSLENIEWHIHFVDAMTLWNSGYYACMSDNETGNVGKYLSVDNNQFSLTPEWEYIGTVSIDFPYWSRDTYHWCVVYSVYDDVVSNAWYSTNMASRKALPFTVTLSWDEIEIRMIANLWSRWNANTSNSKWYESKWKILFYERWNFTEPKYSWYVIMDHEGRAILTWVKVMTDCYNVVYKWRHHLASYIPDLCVHSWGVINFVSWNVIWTNQFDDNLPYNGWLHYQIAWDLPDASGYQNGIINSSDISVLYDCDYMTHRPSNTHICDLNHDTWVDSTDAWVIIKNYREYDRVYYSWWVQWEQYYAWQFTWLWLVNYLVGANYLLPNYEFYYQ